MHLRDLVWLSPIAAVLLPSVFRLIGSVRMNVAIWRFTHMSPEKRRKLIDRESRKAAVQLGATLAVVRGALGEFSGPDTRDYLNED